MTHMAPMPDSSGTFGKTEEKLYECRRCGQQTAECRVWESSCGGYEDYNYNCTSCKYSWWVDGIDS